MGEIPGRRRSSTWRGSEAFRSTGCKQMSNTNRSGDNDIPASVHGDLAYVSGQFPRRGEDPRDRGKVGDEVTIRPRPLSRRSRNRRIFLRISCPHPVSSRTAPGPVPARPSGRGRIPGEAVSADVSPGGRCRCDAPPFRRRDRARYGSGAGNPHRPSSSLEEPLKERLQDASGAELPKN